MSIVKKRKISEAEDDNVSVKSDATTVSASDDEATPSSGKRQRPNTPVGQTVTMTSTTSSTTVSTTKATQVTEVSITESSSHSETTTTTALSDPKQSVPAPAPTPPIHPFFTKSGLGTNTNTSGGSPTHTNPFSKVKWSKHGSVIVGTYGTQSANTHIAAFDFDGTLASVRGKHVYPKNGDDWRFFHPSIPSRLVSLSVDEGFRIVIMSNQKDIEKNKQRKAAFMGRVENVVRAIELYAEKEGKAVPSILVFGAVEDDWCRKPRPGMWELLETDFNNGVAVDKEHSFYVGDAAGRPQDHVPGTKRDFADTDYKFALNVRCQFYTPEGFFHFKTLDQAVPAHKAQHPSHAPPDPAFDPKEYLQKTRLTSGDTGSPSHRTDTSSSSTLNRHLATDIPPGRHPELVILVGLPASGKSRFALHKLVPHGYTRVNQDLLKTRDKCLKTAEHALMNNPHKSVVVDNTNPDRATRRAYVEMARRVSGKLRVGVGVRCFEFVTPEEVCLHNNAYRSLVGRSRSSLSGSGSGVASGGGETTNGTTNPSALSPSSPSHYSEPHRDRVPRLAYQQFHARYQKPDVSEGFDEVITVEFAAEFRNEEEEEVWQMYFV